ncbi:MAG: TetR/AcrR family transcriptional regulator [Planctomycetota bacterium]|nr:MAG: TetR/AcrR family transcriptional regulator [Planctomycetota bacterium]
MARRKTGKKARPRRRAGRPSGERGKETETRILDVAERVFARVGFAGASTQEIAEEAGVTKAMIHYYFDSKELLYRAVLDRILFELIRLVQEVTLGEEDRVRRLEHFVSGFFDYVARHPHFGRLTYMGSGSEGRYFENIVTTFFRPLFEKGCAFIEEGIAAGTFRQVDPAQTLLSIYTVTMGYFADAHFISLILEDEALGPARLAVAKRAVLDLVRSLLVASH